MVDAVVMFNYTTNLNNGKHKADYEDGDLELVDEAKP